MIEENNSEQTNNQNTNTQISSKTSVNNQIKKSEEVADNLNNSKKEKKRKFYVPTIYSIMLVIAIATIFLTWIIPGTDANQYYFYNYLLSLNDIDNSTEITSSSPVITYWLNYFSITNYGEYKDFIAQHTSYIYTYIDYKLGQEASWLLSSTSPGNWTDWNDFYLNGLEEGNLDTSTFYLDQKQPAGIFDILYAPIIGFIEIADIAVFLLFIGGMINIVVETKTLETGIQAILKKANGKEIIIFPILFTFFSLGGTVYGMQEETVSYFLIIMPAVVIAGFDALSAVMCITFGVMTGIMASSLNPFTVGIAASSVNTGSTDLVTYGLFIRFATWIVFTIIGATFVTVYAWKVKAKPESSPLYEESEKYQQLAYKYVSKEEHKITKKQLVAFISFIFVLIAMMILMIPWATFFTDDGSFGYTETNPWLGYFTNMPEFGLWGVVQVAVLFFVASIYFMILLGINERDGIGMFMRGASGMISLIFIISFARAPYILMHFSGIDITIVAGLSVALAPAGAYGFPLLSFFIFGLLAFIIPSSSGLAALSFPIIGSVAYSVGGAPSAAATVTAYTTSFGIVQTVSPTNGINMAGLELTQVPYSKYLRVSLIYCGIMVFVSLITIELQVLIFSH